MTTPYHITETQVISDRWGTLQSVKYETTDRDGRNVGHEAELYDTGNAVAVLLYNRAKRTVILNSQFRIATVFNGHSSGMLTEVCAGKIENLSPEETVRKEVSEETGYAVEDVEKVAEIYMSPGAFTELLHFYTAEYTPGKRPGKGGGLKEEGEDIRVNETAFDEAIAMIDRGDIRDAKTVILLQYAALKGLM